MPYHGCEARSDRAYPFFSEQTISRQCHGELRKLEEAMYYPPGCRRFKRSRSRCVLSGLRAEP
jgi:hypothetical protein